MPILFDLDGTLFDTAPDTLLAINQLLKAYNKKAVLENNHEFRRLVATSAKPVLTQFFEPHRLEDALSCLQKIIVKNNHPQTKLFSGVEDLLETLDKTQITWGIVTNRSSVSALPLIKKHALENRAACVVCGDTYPQKKPHPMPVLKACELLKIKPSETLFIGDSHHDTESGKAANTKTVTVTYGYIPSIEIAKTWNADYVIKHPSEILQIPELR